MVDDNNNVVINSPETVAALEYAKQLYATFIDGVLSWNDSSNNKAFLPTRSVSRRTEYRSTRSPRTRLTPR